MWRPAELLAGPSLSSSEQKGASEVEPEEEKVANQNWTLAGPPHLPGREGASSMDEWTDRRPADGHGKSETCIPARFAWASLKADQGSVWMETEPRAPAPTREAKEEPERDLSVWPSAEWKLPMGPLRISSHDCRSGCTLETSLCRR